MKLKNLLFLSALMSVGTAGAQPPHAPMSNEDEVRQTVERWKEAFEAKDIDRLMSFYAPGDAIVGFDIGLPSKFTTRDAYTNNFKDLFKMLGKQKITLDIRYLQVIASDDVAFYSSVQHLTGRNEDGKVLTDMWVRGSSGLRKIGNQWKIVHDHTSVPIDMSTHRPAFDAHP